MLYSNIVRFISVLDHLNYFHSFHAHKEPCVHDTYAIAPLRPQQLVGSWPLLPRGLPEGNIDVNWHCWGQS